MGMFNYVYILILSPILKADSPLVVDSYLQLHTKIHRW